MSEPPSFESKSRSVLHLYFPLTSLHCSMPVSVSVVYSGQWVGQSCSRCGVVRMAKRREAIFTADGVGVGVDPVLSTPGRDMVDLEGHGTKTR